MTTFAVQDIPVSLKCVGGTAIGTIPAGISTYFRDAQYILLGCWMKYTTKADGVNWRDYLVFRGDSGSSAFAGLFINNTAEQLAVSALGAGSAFYDVAPNTWYHTVAEIDIGASRVRLWVNGVRVFESVTTFARNLLTVSPLVSYIGDSGAPGFDGNVADPFICNRAARVTDAEMADCYHKGVLPHSLHSFRWPVRKAVGTTVECEVESAAPPFPQNQFNLALSTSTMYSRDVPMTGRFADRSGGSCLRLSGSVGYYRHNTNNPYNALKGAPVVIASLWLRNTNPNTGVSNAAFYLFASGGNAGLLITKNTSRHLEVGGRSTDGDTYQSTSVQPSGLDGNYLDSTRWFHVIGVWDYANARLRLYVNGVMASELTGAAFASNTFQVTRGSQEVWIGANTNFWPGYLDDICVFRSDVLPSAQDMREYYLKGLAAKPNPWKPIFIIDCDDFGPNLIDKSGNGIDFAPISVSPPYGLHPLSYIP